MEPHTASFRPGAASIMVFFMAEAPQREPMSMPLKVLIGGVLGIATGVFLGDEASFLAPVGSAYVLLIQAVVYPYIIASLLRGLGGLSPATAIKLFKRGWPFYTGLWALVLGATALLSLGLPHVEQDVYRPQPPVSTSVNTLLNILLPADPFSALSENHMPAVVIFCLIFGAALQFVDNKQRLLDMLETVRMTSMQFWRWIGALVPYATFALFAASAGSMPLSSLPKIGLYLALLLFCCMMLALWILPAILSAFVPASYREIMHDLKDGLTIAIATSVVAAAIPYIVESTRKLADRCNIEDENRRDLISTNLSIGYVIASAGSLLLYLFVLFMGYYFSTSISLTDSIVLPLIILLSSVGSSVSALEFINSWLGMPQETVHVYLETGMLAKYPKIILTLMSLAFVSILVTLNFYGKLKIHFFKLVRIALPPLVILAAGAWGIGFVERNISQSHPLSYADFSLSPQITRNVQAHVEDSASGSTGSGDAVDGETAFERIQRTGALRVGIFDSSIPFSYYNDDHELVGYDIAFAYELAYALDVDLVFVPFKPHQMADELINGHIDIAMSGLYVTQQRLRDLIISDSYLKSEPALLGQTNVVSGLLSRNDIEAYPDLTLGSYHEPSLLNRLKARLPDVSVNVVPPYESLPDFSSVDAAVWSLVSARAMAKLYDGVAASVPENLGDPFVYVFYMAPDNRRLHIFVNTLVRDLKSVGWHERQAQHWLEGLGDQHREPRWSIMRNVLGWGVDETETGAGT